MTSFLVMSTVRIAPSLIFIFIVSFGRAARIPCIDASPSALLLRLLNPTEEPDACRQHSAEFASGSMEQFSKLGNSKRTSPRSSRLCIRHGDDALRFNNDVHQTLAR